MSMDYFSIGTEFDAAWGRSTVSSTILPIPENKREIPCDTCALADECAAEILECAAFRNWASRGDYADRDVARLVRAAK